MTERTIYADGQRRRIQTDFSESVSRTQQHFKDECDINTIMSRWQRTGELSHLNTRKPEYGDFDNVDDYQSAVNSVMHAQEAFDALSSRIRKRMNNDPGQLLAFLEDPSNHDEAVELGLIRNPEPDPTGGPDDQGATASEGGETPPTPSPQPGGETPHVQ